MMRFLYLIKGGPLIMERKVIYVNFKREQQKKRVKSTFSKFTALITKLFYPLKNWNKKYKSRFNHRKPKKKSI